CRSWNGWTRTATRVGSIPADGEKPSADHALVRLGRYDRFEGASDDRVALNIRMDVIERAHERERACGRDVQRHGARAEWHLGEVVRVERARNVRHLQAEDAVFERLQSVERVGDL